MARHTFRPEKDIFRLGLVPDGIGASVPYARELERGDQVTLAGYKGSRAVSGRLVSLTHDLGRAGYLTHMEIRCQEADARAYIAAETRPIDSLEDIPPGLSDEQHLAYFEQRGVSERFLEDVEEAKTDERPRGRPRGRAR